MHASDNYSGPACREFEIPSLVIFDELYECRCRWLSVSRVAYMLSTVMRPVATFFPA